MKGSIGVSTSYKYLFSKTALYNRGMLKSVQSILAFNKPALSNLTG